MRIILSILFSIFLLLSKAQSPLVSGPMVGYVEHFSTLIWIEVGKNVTEASIKYWESNSKQSFTQKYKGELGKHFNPLKFELEGLKINTTYNYEVILNGKPVKFSYPLTFKTKDLWEWRKDAPDFSFLFGSCLYINDSIYDRPGKPYGQSPDIMKVMGDMPSDFMLWGGDNIYLREVDWSSKHGIYYRNSHTRKHPAIKKLLATRANFATLDDHDFGPNDANESYELKDDVSRAFEDYWGNKSFGEDGKGLYTKFKWSDTEFFLLDNRSFRSANDFPDSVNGKSNPGKTYFGPQQMKWLKNSLLSSKAPFKFIVVGGQVLNKMTLGESLYQFPYEYNELLDFIVSSKIEGVIFLSGDRHFSEIIKHTPANFYTMYDFTCSALTSGAYNITKKKEFNNPDRVPGMLLMENNFGKISVSGKPKERTVTIQTYDAKGSLKFEHKIGEQELKLKR